MSTTKTVKLTEAELKKALRIYLLDYTDFGHLVKNVKLEVNPTSAGGSWVFSAQVELTNNVD